MPRSAAPQWRKRKQPILDHLIIESINRAYSELIYGGIETRGRADEIKRALFRAAKHIPDTSVSAHVEKIGSGYQVRFRAHKKSDARQYMLDHYGTDRSKYPYSPWRADPNFDPTTFKEDDNG